MPHLICQKIRPKHQYNGPQKQGHSATYIQKLNSILVVGGSKKTDVFTYQVSKKQWSYHKTTGHKPDSIKYHAAYYEQSINCLIVHGGQIQKYSSNQCFVLSLDLWVWRKVFIPISMPTRQHHMFIQHQTNYGKQLFLFGGISLPYGKYLNDLWKVSQIQKLQIKSNLHQIQNSKWELIKTNGQKSPQIFGYFAKVINNKIFIFGGREPDIQRSFTIYTLSLKSFKWQYLSFQNKYCPPLTNLYVCQSVIQKNKYYIFGGSHQSSSNKIVYSFNLQKLRIVQQNLIDKFQKIMSNSVCEITHNPLCLAFIQWDNEKEDLQINVVVQQDKRLYSSKRESHFATDQYENQISSSSEDISIQDILKAIKHQQILSQELISKNKCLQQIYKQIQRYITKLYQNYLKSGQYVPTIEKQKQKSIKRCQTLKDNYIQIEEEYSQIVSKIKHYRSLLGEIHEDFQRCMETEIDQQIQ